jgi:hypothetical protein
MSGRIRAHITAPFRLPALDQIERSVYGTSIDAQLRLSGGHEQRQGFLNIYLFKYFGIGEQADYGNSKIPPLSGGF